jgi:zinc protease
MRTTTALGVLAALSLAASPGRVVAQRAPVKPAPAAAAAANVLPFRATERTLPNGLKVIVVPTGFPNIVSVQIPVRTGSRNEIEPGKSGFAHFFEHMMFRGTPTYSPEAYNKIITGAGARQNAFTSDDFTNYHTTFAKEDLETVLKVEADRFQHLSYAEPEFKTEARAVLGEYNKNAAEPLRKLAEVQREAAFTTHTYRHTTMGFLKDIEDMPNQYEYSKVFFDRWYRPENAAVIVAGDVTAEEVLPLVEKYFGSWKRGSYAAEIPREPAPRGPVYAHVPWATPTIPWVTVAFHGPAFSSTSKDYAALDMVADLLFGQTSELYKQLVEREQKVDQFGPSLPQRQDPQLLTVFARVKRPEDAVYVRDEILRTVARARTTLIPVQRLADAKSNARYSFVRSLDNTETIAATVAAYARFDRRFATVNELYRTYESLTPRDLQAAAQKYFTDAGLVVTTLSRDPLPEGIAKLPALASFGTQAAAAAAGRTLVESKGEVALADDLRVELLPTPLPQLNVKLLFTAGSAHDPDGKEGLAALSAAMIAEAGSRTMAIDQINRAFFPMAASFSAQVDKEMTALTGSVHRDNWRKFTDIVLPMLLDPGFREEDFKRLKDAQLNALTQDLRSNNEEELGKERLQGNIFRGTPYEHPVLGTVAGIQSITLDDVRGFVRGMYTRGALTVGVAGDAPPALVTRLRTELGKLPAGAAPTATAVTGRRPNGMEVEIIEKDTRSTAISFGLPIPVTRAHPDYAALWVARTWLGEHRASMSHLYKRIRETRGMNYGDYAYIEAFPRGMFQFFPDPNIARRAQIFEVWIRPVMPQNAHMALRIATHELDNLLRGGLTQDDFETVRNYLMKNVYVMTATQNQQLGYHLDSKWYGIPEFTGYMRDRLSKLTRDDVNRAIRQHLSASDLSVVIITKDARGLRDALVADAPSAITYDAPKPQALLDEDKVIGARKLGIRAENVRITPVAEVFAK